MRRLRFVHGALGPATDALGRFLGTEDPPTRAPSVETTAEPSVTGATHGSAAGGDTIDLATIDPVELWTCSQLATRMLLDERPWDLWELLGSKAREIKYAQQCGRTAEYLDRRDWFAAHVLQRHAAAPETDSTGVRSWSDVLVAGLVDRPGDPDMEGGIVHGPWAERVLALGVLMDTKLLQQRERHAEVARDLDTRWEPLLARVCNQPVGETLWIRQQLSLLTLPGRADAACAALLSTPPFGSVDAGNDVRSDNTRRIAARARVAATLLQSPLGSSSCAGALAAAEAEVANMEPASDRDQVLLDAAFVAAEAGRCDVAHSVASVVAARARVETTDRSAQLLARCAQVLYRIGAVDEATTCAEASAQQGFTVATPAQELRSEELNTHAESIALGIMAPLRYSRSGGRPMDRRGSLAVTGAKRTVEQLCSTLRRDGYATRAERIEADLRMVLAWLPPSAE